jgi:hypothetical protein
MIDWKEDGSVEMPSEWKVKKSGKFFIFDRGRWIDCSGSDGYKATAFESIMREQYGIEVK